VPYRVPSCVITSKSSAVAEMGDRLATIGMGRKLGAAVPLSGGGGLGPHLTQSRLGRGLPLYQLASLSIQPFGHNTPTLYRQTGQDRQRSDSVRGTGDIVLHGDPAPPPQRGTASNFRPMSVVAKRLDG